jgi:hypothetical protein
LFIAQHPKEAKEEDGGDENDTDHRVSKMNVHGCDPTKRNKLSKRSERKLCNRKAAHRQGKQGHLF